MQLYLSKQDKMKENIGKDYVRRIKKFLETKLCHRNLIKGINTLAVPFVRYLGLFLKWTKDKLRQMDKRTRNNKNNNYDNGLFALLYGFKYFYSILIILE